MQNCIIAIVRWSPWCKWQAQVLLLAATQVRECFKICAGGWCPESRFFVTITFSSMIKPTPRLIHRFQKALREGG